jgi:hypothetical protein
MKKRNEFFRRGFFNRYNDEKPAIDRYIKDISHLFWSLRFLVRYGRIRWWVVYPHYCARKSTIFKIARYLGYHVTNRPKKKPEVLVRFDYHTFKKETPYLDEKKAGGYTIINYHSRDISKFRVDEVHEEVFGYSTRVDPLQHHGYMVKKSNINGLHDGTIIEGPLAEAEADSIYQILIDNTTEDGHYEDIRIAVVGEQLPVAYLKYRKPDERFGHKSKARLTTPDAVLSAEEIRKVKEYMKALALDFAEIDILRDKKDGKIYIIDVNDTPHSARDNVSKEELKENIHILAEAFRKEFLT